MEIKYKLREIKNRINFTRRFVITSIFIIAIISFMSAGYFFTAFTGHSTANVINEDAEQMEIIIPLSNFGDIDLKDLSTELTQTTQFRVESPEGEGVFETQTLRVCPTDPIKVKF